MPFNDTTNKNGLIQVCEDWTNLGEGAISGDSTQLKKFTVRINEAFSRLMPLLLSYDDHLRWDDNNQPDLPVGYVDIVSGQSDYQIKTDTNGLNILNITEVLILPSATATLYIPCTRITPDSYWAPFAMSPNSGMVGTPTSFLEHNNTLYLFVQPNYSVANGIKVYFERDPAYFVSTDTTKTPGIPRPFHALLALYASYDWIVQNKGNDTTLITRLEAQIARREKELSDLVGSRNPTHARMSMRQTNSL